MKPAIHIANECLFISLMGMLDLCNASDTLATFTLDGYIAQALAHNPAISAVQSEIAASEQDIVLARSLPDPMLMGKVGIDGGLRPTAIGVSQMIMQPATLAFEKKAAVFRADAQRALLQQAMADLVFNVRSTYFMLYETGQLLAIRRRNLELLRQYEVLTTTAYENGSAAQSNLLKIGIEIARLEDDLESDHLRGVSQRRELAALLGMNRTPDFPFPDVLPDSASTPTADSAVALSLELFPALAAMNHSISNEKAMVSSARSRFFPDFGIDIEYMKASNGSMSDGAWMWTPSISASFPLWFWKQTAAVRKSRLNVAAMESRYDDMRNMTASEAVSLVNDLRDARRRRQRLVEVLVPQARQMLLLMENEYRTGLSRSIDVLDGQRMLLDLEMENVMQATRAMKAQAGLLRLFGDTGKETEQ